MDELTLNLRLAVPAGQLEAMIRDEVRRVALEKFHWLTIKEAAEHMRISERKFAGEYKVWGLPFSKIDGMIRFSREDLDTFLRANQIRPKVPVLKFPTAMESPAETSSAA